MSWFASIRAEFATHSAEIDARMGVESCAALKCSVPGFSADEPGTEQFNLARVRGEGTGSQILGA